MENITVADGNPTTPTPEEKTFTQEQLNAIVQERLARAQAKYDADKAELETRAVMAERRLVLHRNAVPEELTEKYIKLAELYPNDENDFDKSLNAAIADFQLPRKVTPRFVGPSSSMGIRSGSDPIREGMGLNRKE